MPRGSNLEVVRAVRSAALDEAIERHREAEQSAERARAEAAKLADREAGVRREHAEAMRSERARIESGGAPRDLAHLASFDAGGRARIAAAAASAQAAAQRSHELQAHVEVTRQALSAAKADLEAIDRHRENLRQAAIKAADAAVDEAAEEAHAARRLRG